MTVDDFYERSPVLAYVMQQPQRAVLLNGLAVPALRGGLTNSLAFDGGAVGSIEETAQWCELSQGRWAWTLRLTELPDILIAGIGLGSTPDERGFSVVAHWVGARTEQEIRDWYEKWTTNTEQLAASFT